MKKILEILKVKWLRQTSSTILLIAIIVIAFLAINIGIEKLDLSDIDLTEDKVFSLTEESKTQVASLPEEDQINIYLFDYTENTATTDLVKQYTKVNKNINVEIIESSDRPDLTSKYEIEEGYYSIVIESGEKHKVLNSYDLYTYDYNTGATVDITEQRITNSIISVSSIGETIPIYLLTGHGELSVEIYLATVKTYLELENYEVKELDILVTGNVPEDCSALIISSPATDFSDFETEKIKEYINRGGDILYMSDPFSTTEELKNIQSILDMYGVTIPGNGIMIEQEASKIVLQSPDLILPTIEDSSLAGELSEEGRVVFLATGKLTLIEDNKFGELGVVKTELLTTSDEAFYRTDLSLPSFEPTEGEEVGKQVVGAALEKSLEGGKTSKLVVYANNMFAIDYPITIDQQKVSAVRMYNNLDFVLNSVAYVTEYEDKITIRKDVETTSYTATQTQDLIVRCIIYGVPVLIILFGLGVWIVRKRKK